MITIRQNKDVYEIFFPYDPNVVYLVKQVPGRRWNPDDKMWTIPKDRLGFLVNQIKGTVYEASTRLLSEEDINVNETLSKDAVIPDIDLSKIPFYVKGGGKPYQHQLDFMKWAIDRQRKGNLSGFILADDQGLGKTLEVMNLALYNRKQYKFKHCLVICCINSSKYNWKNDIELHSNGKEQAYILGSRLKRDGSIRVDTGSAEKLQDLETMKMYGKGDPLPYFLIVNVEALRSQTGKNYKFADKLIELINNDEINMIAIDEVHKNVSVESTQGKQLLRIKKATKRIMWIPMTGTPITKKPTDVFTPLKLCDGHSFNSNYKWCQEFCIYGGFGGHDIVAYKNIPKLKQMLEPNMLRRLKDDVLDLPPKIHYTEYVENTSYQKRLYKDVTMEIYSQKDEILRALNPMVRFLKLRQVNGSPELVDESLDIESDSYISKNAKLRRLMDIIDDVVERDEKIVVFSNWVEPLRTLYKYISKKYKTCVFTGTMTVEGRERHKQAFMHNPEYKVLLGTIGAAGTSHTFTAARNLVFYDSPWNPSDRAQAEDRIYRIGTTQSVNIYTLVTKDTVDERVEEILSTKDGIAKYIVDNKLDLKKNPQLFDFLLGGNNETS